MFQNARMTATRVFMMEVLRSALMVAAMLVLFLTTPPKNAKVRGLLRSCLLGDLNNHSKTEWRAEPAMIIIIVYYTIDSSIQQDIMQ